MSLPFDSTVEVESAKKHRQNHGADDTKSIEEAFITSVIELVE